MPVKVIPRIGRGCGTRKTGGLYLFFAASVVQWCHRLPFAVPDACPCCGEHLRQIRSLQTINPLKLFGNAAAGEACTATCPVCHPPEAGGLMWIGKQYYTPESFAEEARRHGISKRIAQVPKGLKQGDLVFFAHPRAIEVQDPDGQVTLDGSRGAAVAYTSGIFLAARLTEIQKVLSEDQVNDVDLVRDLEEKGIQPVIESDAIDAGMTPDCCREVS